MLGPNPILEKTMRADLAVTKYRVVKRGAAEDDAKMAVAATDAQIGVAQHDALDNAVVRIMMLGISKVEFGGNVTQGDLLTVDASGRAIAATRHTHVENVAGAYTQNASTNAGTGERSIGLAMSDGAVGDIGTVMLYPAFV